MSFDEFDQRIISGKICPYCFKEPEFVDSKVVYGRSYGMIYYCKDCDAYVGVHKNTNQALGRLANKELREAKKNAHYYFDHLWAKKMSLMLRKKKNPSKKEVSAVRRIVRNQAYSWLSKMMKLPSKHTHIGMFTVERCNEVINICKPYIKKY
jgi:hypothetical protein